MQIVSRWKSKLWVDENPNCESMKIQSNCKLFRSSSSALPAPSRGSLSMGWSMLSSAVLKRGRRHHQQALHHNHWQYLKAVWVRICIVNCIWYWQCNGSHQSLGFESNRPTLDSLPTATTLPLSSVCYQVAINLFPMESSASSSYSSLSSWRWSYDRGGLREK